MMPSTVTKDGKENIVAVTEMGGGKVLERVKQPFKTFEEALSRAGLFGRYQIFTCAVVQYASIMWAGNYSFMSLGKIEPDWQCDDVGWNHTRHNAPNNGSSEFCFMIKNCTNLTTINDQFTSLVEEWKLVCNLESVPDFLLLIYVGGRICGSIVGGHIGDHLGRKRGFFSAQFFILVTKCDGDLLSELANFCCFPKSQWILFWNH